MAHNLLTNTSFFFCVCAVGGCLVRAPTEPPPPKSHAGIGKTLPKLIKEFSTGKHEWSSGLQAFLISEYLL